jgi:anti-sigma-K factor RskA
MHLFEMYSKLNPRQRREVQIEVNRQRRIEELEAELTNALKKVSFWKSTLCVFAVVVSLVLALK